MKNKLLVTTALVAAFSATNVLADEIKGPITTANADDGTYHIQGTNTLDNAHIKIISEGDPEGFGTRVSFDGATGNTITVNGKNVIEEQLTVHSKTEFKKGDDDAHLQVNGWMTQTDLASNGGQESDLSAVDITIGKNSKNDGALVLASGLKAGNITFDDTRISLWKEDGSELELKDGSTLTFNGTGKIDGQEGSSLTISGTDTSLISNGTLSINKNVTASNTTFENNGNLIINSAVSAASVNNKGHLDLTNGTLTASNVTLMDDSTLSFNVDKVKNGNHDQSGGQVNGSIATNLGTDGSATINPVISINAGSGEYTYATGSVTVDSGSLKLSQDNALYNVSFDVDNKNVLDIIKKDSSEVAASVTNAGGTASNANTINAWVGGNADASSLTGASLAVAEHLNTLAQTDKAAMVSAATALAPETSPMVQHTQTQTANQVFGAVGTRLTGGSISTGGQGMSSGDNIFERASLWVQGLFNKSKLDDTASAKGFDADSNGIAMGAEKHINDNTKVGLGYAYTNTDIDGFMRSTDVDTHTAFVYGEYKPSNWYVNGIASYGWSDYSEDKNVSGLGVKSDYDAETFGLQAMTGYDMQMKNFALTPEVGLRYVHISQDGYTDSAGQKVSGSDSDILTGVIGAKISKKFALENGMNLKPEARIAATYDLMNDDTSSVVTLANGSAYTVEGEALDRFGMEFGAGLTAEVNDNVELSLGYEGKFRQDYQDHTGLLNAKYNF